jgi:hypothetical protein
MYIHTNIHLHMYIMAPVSRNDGKVPPRWRGQLLIGFLSHRRYQTTIIKNVSISISKKIRFNVRFYIQVQAPNRIPLSP